MISQVATVDVHFIGELGQMTQDLVGGHQSVN